MGSPLLIYPRTTLLLPPALAGSVERYAAMAMYGHVAADRQTPYDKRRKAIHRYTIAGANGPQTLTVPLVKPEIWHSTRVADLRVSTHGQWWHVHWEALASAYGRTPFFEYYADDLRPAFSGQIEMLTDLDRAIDLFCRTALGLDCITPDADHAVGDHITTDVPAIQPIPYSQLWADRFGFMPSLSVLDLIFNLGPEAPLHLHRLIRATLALGKPL